MCAIVDANVRDQVFGDAQSDAGKFFLDWLLKPNGGTLALGGKLRKELSDNGRNGNFMRVYGQLRLDGRAKDIPDSVVDAETAALEARLICRSDDAHVLALARVSGARLLFTNEPRLIADFKDNRIISRPPGQIYHSLGTIRIGGTIKPGDKTDAHDDLLNRRRICAL